MWLCSHKTLFTKAGSKVNLACRLYFADLCSRNLRCVIFLLGVSIVHIEHPVCSQHARQYYSLWWIKWLSYFHYGLDHTDCFLLFWSSLKLTAFKITWQRARAAHQNLVLLASKIQWRQVFFISLVSAQDVVISISVLESLPTCFKLLDSQTC